MWRFSDCGCSRIDENVPHLGQFTTFIFFVSFTASNPYAYRVLLKDDNGTCIALDADNNIGILDATANRFFAADYPVPDVQWLGNMFNMLVVHQFDGPLGSEPFVHSIVEYDNVYDEYSKISTVSEGPLTFSSPSDDPRNWQDSEYSAVRPSYSNPPFFSFSLNDIGGFGNIHVDGAPRLRNIHCLGGADADFSNSVNTALTEAGDISVFMCFRRLLSYVETGVIFDAYRYRYGLNWRTLSADADCVMSGSFVPITPCSATSCGEVGSQTVSNTVVYPASGRGQACPPYTTYATACRAGACPAPAGTDTWSRYFARYDLKRLSTKIIFVFDASVTSSMQFTWHADTASVRPVSPYVHDTRLLTAYQSASVKDVPSPFLLASPSFATDTTSQLLQAAVPSPVLHPFPSVAPDTTSQLLQAPTTPDTIFSVPDADKATWQTYLKGADQTHAYYDEIIMLSPHSSPDSDGIPKWSFQVAPAVHVIDGYITDLPLSSPSTLVVISKVRNVSGESYGSRRRVLCCGALASNLHLCIEPVSEEFAMFNATAGSYVTLDKSVTSVQNYDTAYHMYTFQISTSIPYLQLSVDAETSTSSSYDVSSANSAGFSCIGCDIYDASQSAWGDIAVIMMFDGELTIDARKYIYSLYYDYFN